MTCAPAGARYRYSSAPGEVTVQGHDRGGADPDNRLRAAGQADVADELPTASKIGAAGKSVRPASAPLAKTRSDSGNM